MAKFNLSEADARTIAKMAYMAVRAAEYAITGTKQGAKRMEQCIDWIYDILPAALKAFVTRDMLQEFIQQAWEQMTGALEKAAN